MKIFNKPYPIDTRIWHNCKIHILIGLFVTYLLIVFQPFGTAHWVTKYKNIKLGGYGILAIIVPTILIILRNWLTIKYNFEQNYKVKHELYWLMTVLLCIALANCLYIVFLHEVKFSYSLLKYGIFMVCAIGLFPILISVILKYNNYQALISKEAEVLDNLIDRSEVAPQESFLNHSTMILIAENGKDKCSFDSSLLLYIESAENYVNIVYIENGLVTKKLLRSSLHKIESQINDPFITKCHRCFIINLHQVNHFTGNAQGYLMSFSNCNVLVPVSRSYCAKISFKMKNFSY